MTPCLTSWFFWCGQTVTFLSIFIAVSFALSGSWCAGFRDAIWPLGLWRDSYVWVFQEWLHDSRRQKPDLHFQRWKGNRMDRQATNLQRWVCPNLTINSIQNRGPKFGTDIWDYVIGLFWSGCKCLIRVICCVQLFSSSRTVTVKRYSQFH